MDYPIVFKLTLLTVLFILSGLFSCSEAALFSLTSLHLHKMEADRLPFLSSVRRLIAYPRRLLITVLIGNESVNIGISILTTSLFVYLLGVDAGWMAIAVATPLVVIFGEAIPKTFGIVHPIRFASLVAPFLMPFYRFFFPAVWGLEKITGWFVARLSPEDLSGRPAVMEDEFKTLIDAGHKEGALEESQRDLIHRVFDLGDKPVVEVMIPRVDMFCLPLSMTLAEMEKEIIKARHTLVPIYGSDRDDIIGLLQAKDMLHIPSGGDRPGQIDKLLRKPYFVPLEKTAGSLLRDFQEKKIKMAIVVDEYGGVSGLVTLEDILESLVEDMYDRCGIRESLYEWVNGQTVIVSGQMLMDDFMDISGLAVPGGDFETVAGFVFHLFGKLPAPGESVRHDRFIFRIEKMGKARILQVRVEIQTPERQGEPHG